MNYQRKSFLKFFQKILVKLGRLTKTQNLYLPIKNFNKQIINNELTKYEYSIVHDALQKDLFRYDASEIMDRSIGSNLLWELFKEYISEGPQNLVKLLNELDREI